MIGEEVSKWKAYGRSRNLEPTDTWKKIKHLTPEIPAEIWGNMDAIEHVVDFQLL